MLKNQIAYRYDGSFEGFLCCIFDSFYRQEFPAAILSEEDPQGILYPERYVETDFPHAQRVFASLSKRISKRAEQFVSKAFLTCLPERELLLLRFLRMGYRDGDSVMNRLADDTVHELHRAVQYLNNEVHYYKEFLRFSEQNKTLAAVISPKNHVLPLIAPHYCGRYPEETFLIYDDVHHEALVYRPYESVIAPLEHFSLEAPEEQELQFRALWKCFYDAIAIEGRYNPKCRMNHMPKRYWNNMTEFQGDTCIPGKPSFSPVEKPKLQ